MSIPAAYWLISSKISPRNVVESKNSPLRDLDGFFEPLRARTTFNQALSLSNRASSTEFQCGGARAPALLPLQQQHNFITVYCKDRDERHRHVYASELVP